MDATRATAPPIAAQSNGSTAEDGYLSVEDAIANAPADCEERDVEGVFGGKVRVRSLTAAQAARVKQASISLAGRNPDVAWAEMEMRQFEFAVIKPKFSPDQVKTLHLSAGKSFAKVIGVIDEMSGMNKEELREAQREFPNSDD